MGVFARILGLALLTGGHVVLPFIVYNKMAGAGFPPAARIFGVVLLVFLGGYNVVREVRRLIRQEQQKKKI